MNFLRKLFVKEAPEPTAKNTPDKIDPDVAKPDRVSELIYTLNGRSLSGGFFLHGFQERAAAARELGQKGGPHAVEALIAALAGDTAAGHWEANVAAAEALGEIGDPRATRPLVVALTAFTTSLREAARKALTKIDPNWPRSEAAREAIPELIATLENDDWTLWEFSATVLGEIGDSRAIEPLISKLENSNQWPVRDDTRRELRQAMSRALAEITGEGFGEDAEKWLQWWKQKGRTNEGVDATKTVQRFEESLSRYLSACDETDKVLDKMDKVLSGQRTIGLKWSQSYKG